MLSKKQQEYRDIKDRIIEVIIWLIIWALLVGLIVLVNNSLIKRGF